MTCFGHPKKRIAQLQNSCPNKIILIGYIPSVRPQDLEKRLHDRYKKNRIHGEWFDVDIELIKNEILVHNHDSFSKPKVLHP